MNELKERLTQNPIRERLMGLFCLTVIAILAMVRLEDPENIIVNIVVAIASFLTGASSTRRSDTNNPKEPQ